MCTSTVDYQFDPSILRHSEIWVVADEAVLNNVHKKKNLKIPLLYIINQELSRKYSSVLISHDWLKFYISCGPPAFEDSGMS
jgi:hypothetical protein